jgi:HEPN domain-containing protein
MTTQDLAQSYLMKARSRLKLLSILLEDGDYSDVVREAQEIVELALKGMLRHQGIEPPKWHDVGDMLLAHADRFPPETAGVLGQLAEVSKWLRKERELAFYGDIDFIPSEEYERGDADRAITDAKLVFAAAARLIVPPDPSVSADHGNQTQNSVTSAHSA